jgi:hypothetical protein
MASKPSNRWVRRIEVESFTEYGKTYVVAQRRDGTFGCSCPRWKFKRAELPNGCCKHIEAAKSIKRWELTKDGLAAHRAEQVQSEYLAMGFKLRLLEERPEELAYVASTVLMDYAVRD